MTCADGYIALTSNASAGTAVLANANADAGRPSAAATTNGNVSSVSSAALHAKTIDAKDISRVV
jgi:hypothetical protein